MLVQNDPRCLVAIDMPAGPSEVLVIADEDANPAFVAADLLSQAEHGPDSQAVLLTVSTSPGRNRQLVESVQQQVRLQAAQLPRREIVAESLSKSFMLCFDSLNDAVNFSNDYAPEHLILHTAKPDELLPGIQNAGSVFLGPFSPER
jgi:phosphoribosyl-ATP pyrophosphohydrolase/phosphoribosyl-AMP cyclohydrolase/histidinol dehydrogenase